MKRPPIPPALRARVMSPEQDREYAADPPVTAKEIAVLIDKACGGGNNLMLLRRVMLTLEAYERDPKRRRP